LKGIQGGINGIPVRIEQGDITSKKCDAYVIPQFNSCMSEGGVGGAVMRAGAEQGMLAYEQYLSGHGGTLAFGDACVTAAGGGNAKYLIHVASVGSGPASEFSTIQKAVFNALALAKKRGIKIIGIPALGTGVIGSLTPTQSAKAMMSAVFEFAKKDATLHEINFAIYAPDAVVAEFGNVLKEKSYQHTSDEVGAKKFDFGKWASEMRRDISANDTFRKRN
jgi:O-acetyl-ADP-ribose deacetylase (regulator of RNase III)